MKFMSSQQMNTSSCNTCTAQMRRHSPAHPFCPPPTPLPCKTKPGKHAQTSPQRSSHLKNSLGGAISMVLHHQNLLITFSTHSFWHGAEAPLKRSKGGSPGRGGGLSQDWEQSMKACVAQDFEFSRPLHHFSFSQLCYHTSSLLLKFSKRSGCHIKNGITHLAWLPTCMKSTAL
jgi:hypothetical protein